VDGAGWEIRCLAVVRWGTATLEQWVVVACEWVAGGVAQEMGCLSVGVPLVVGGVATLVRLVVVGASRHWGAVWLCWGRRLRGGIGSEIPKETNRHLGRV
jgi:hypothetical protein